MGSRTYRLVANAPRYTGPRAWDAEGARVAIVTCKRCGAAVVLDPADEVDAIEVHDAWHEALERAGFRVG